MSSANITKIHIHIGPASVLGPIIVNITNIINIKKDLAKGYVNFTLYNKDINSYTFGIPEECNSNAVDCCDQMNSIFSTPITIGGVPITTGI